MLEVIASHVASRGHAAAFTLAGRQMDPFPCIGEADLLGVPSLFDSYPGTILEALHAGTPVIASRVGDIPDMFAHDDLLFEPGNVEAICERIRPLYDHPKRYRTTRELCR